MAGVTRDLIDRKGKDRSINQSTREDGGLSDDVAAWKIAEALGVRIDTCQRLVDSYGAEHALAALFDVQDQLASGHQLRSPIAVMLSKLKKGEIQVQAAEPLNESIETQRKRIHQVLSDPTMDCPQKIIARRPLPAEFAHLEEGEAMVRCPCGCHQEFPSAVR